MLHSSQTNVSQFRNIIQPYGSSIRIKETLVCDADCELSICIQLPRKGHIPTRALAAWPGCKAPRSWPKERPKHGGWRCPRNAKRHRMSLNGALIIISAAQHRRCVIALRAVNRWNRWNFMLPSWMRLHTRWPNWSCSDSDRTHCRTVAVNISHAGSPGWTGNNMPCSTRFSACKPHLP